MLLSRISNDIHQIAAVAKIAQLVEREEGSSSKIRFHPENTIQLDGMADRFVNLKPKLRAIENNGEHSFRTLIRFEQRDGFFPHAAGILNQLQLLNEFVSFVLPLPTVRIRIRPLLNLAACKRVRRVTHT